MCGCEGELVENEIFPVCEKHTTKHDLTRQLMNFIEYHKHYNYTLDYCKQCLDYNPDYIQVLIDNWDTNTKYEGYHHPKNTKPHSLIILLGE